MMRFPSRSVLDSISGVRSFLLTPVGVTHTASAPVRTEMLPSFPATIPCRYTRFPYSQINCFASSSL